MSESEPAKPSVLIVGALGYIGRFLALYIHENQLASNIRLVDKQLPELAWLGSEFSEACSKDKFVQADASRERKSPRIPLQFRYDFHRLLIYEAEFLSKIFDLGDPGKEFDFVFNCGGETKYSQDDEVYKTRSYALSLTLARECAVRRIPILIELSTGMVYKPDSSRPRTESDKLKPWLKLATWKLKAEEDMANLVKESGLNLCVLRLAHVYGPYVSKFLSTALCLARVYQSEEREMKWLWDADLRTNTVHVEDVARAMWAAAEWYTTKYNKTSSSGKEKQKASGFGTIPTFNIVDHGNTSQGTIAEFISSYFSITTGFQGTLVSTFARLHLDSVVDDLNDETLDSWAELQSNAGIGSAAGRPSGPIGPFMEKELLKDIDLSLDGTLFEKTTGFQYKRDKLKEDDIAEIVESYRKMGWWP